MARPCSLLSHKIRFLKEGEPFKLFILFIHQLGLNLTLLKLCRKAFNKTIIKGVSGGKNEKY
jgi:hypothetical protein